MSLYGGPKSPFWDPFWTDLPELYYLNGTPFGPQITLLALLAFGVAWAVRAV